MAVILAGGKGERFWPLSTPKRPKPFLRLFGGKSLLQATFDRLIPLFGERGVYVVAPPHLEALVQEHLPALPKKNLLLEPEPKDTAFAVAFALKQLPEGLVAFFPADNHIGDEEAFRMDLQRLFTAAQSIPGLFTLGVVPTYPATGYGYLERGEEVVPKVYRVRRFLEKPQEEVAQKLYKSGVHYWNAGIFLGTREVWCEEFHRHAPWVLEGQGEKVSLDYALMEKSERIYMTPASFPWDDLGDWTALERHLQSQGGNVVLARHVGLDTKGTIIYGAGEEIVVTIGLEDVVIVREDQVTLIARKNQVARLKEVLRQLGEAEKMGKKPH
ncbi:Alginate biosynthesis protein AlgA [Meiothermus luteus]|uniref:Alginate biosynthesis protein AlgA n=1 Tax=Meiothermus luteus TaxID=2026184 RepID=A0A399EI32_9DEIN|nr:sugar phosphate nucleotidyltransferase [Meiothermus luteus]RIH82729.1 Alginate biosynthesis protein AlgA [Meiothermus luteus]